ncbi:MAG: sugar ABC transporter permease [Candidatus Izemoplasmatales bacterium]|jgi:raffinose/stachyose/melibiose transport system permease protein|nr:sugar ABC transporter permease [Candidatus Izemoplasmatales bacterium]
MSKFLGKLKKVFFSIWIAICVVPSLLIVFPIKRIIVLVKNIMYFLSHHKWKKDQKNGILNALEPERPIVDKSVYKGNNKTIAVLERLFLGYHQKAQTNRTFIYFLLPALSCFIIFVIVPFFMGAYYSLTDWTGLNTGNQVFVGLSNYKTIFTDYRFFYSFTRTVTYTVLNILIINFVAFGLALLVTQNLKLKNIYRAGFFMPNLIGGLVLGYIWQFIFSTAITSLGGNFASSIIAPGNNEHAMLALIVVVTWQYAGYIMMIYIAAIQNVPMDLVEAAKIDGANALQRLKNITFPLVAQAFTVSLFLTLVTSFKQFDTVISLTKSGPTTTLPMWIQNLFHPLVTSVQSLNLIAVNIYQTAFVNREMGIGQAKAIVFFIILLVFSLIQVSVNKKKEVEL